ncbi:helix-turn-helix domain-containing protein [Paenibacillus sp. GCM10027629]|uniref:helix-turn-helix domain-containing protein n=1 Tax=Paenibacillus sp. GCM10027629 TaxID=3273414 RepID=UPI0036263701
MSNLGDLLRNARLEKGMSLDDIQELTKIRKRYLEAIEDGDYKVLPGSFYVRAFVKTYAETLGLDSDEIVQLYKSDIPEPVSESASVEPIIQKRRRSERQRQDRAGKWISAVLMWLFLILIAVVIYFFYIHKASPSTDKVDTGTQITDEKKPPTKEENKGTGTETNPQTTTPETTPDVTPEVPEIVAPTIVPSGKIGKANRIKVQTTSTEPIKVEITASGANSWLNVYKKVYKGEELFNANLLDGTTQTFELGEGLYIRLGNANHMEIKVGGVPIDDGNVARAERFVLQPEVKAPDTTTTTDTSTTTGE